MEFPINPDFPTNFQPHIEIFSIRYFDESVKKYISTGQDEKYYIISPRMIMGDSFSQYPVARIVYGKPEFGKVEFYLPQVAVEHTAVNDDSERAEGYVPLFEGFVIEEDKGDYVEVHRYRRPYPVKIDYAVTLYAGLRRDLEFFRQYLFGIMPTRFTLPGIDGSYWNAFYDGISYEGQVDVSGIRVFIVRIEFWVQALLNFQLYPVESLKQRKVQEVRTSVGTRTKVIRRFTIRTGR